MSSSEARTSTIRSVRRLTGTLATFALAVSAIALGGCADGSGFRPMHGVMSNSADVEARLQQVDIAIIPGRVGQRIRNELLFQGNGGTSPVAPAYRLEIVLTENLTSTLVGKDGEAVSQIYMVDAAYRLINLSDKKVILNGNSFGRASFERFKSIYSNVRAREDAENRAAKTVAQDIKVRLSAFLSGVR